MKPKTQTQQRELIPAGTHLARLYQLIEIGTVDTEYMGEAKKSFKIRLGWELPKLTKVWKEGEDAKPYVISEEYTWSLGEKSKLAPIVTGMIGKSLSDNDRKEFDIETLLGTPCLLNVVHNTKGENTYANILNTSTLIEGLECPKQFNENIVLSYDNFNEGVYEKLLQFLKDKIAKTPEYREAHGMELGEEELNPDEIPF